jgi:ACS family tartrate transporter-like MFS transporter
MLPRTGRQFASARGRYLINNLDKSNLAFAALKMNKDLGFTPSVYGFGAGIFFFSYTLCQMPSNLVLERFGARAWLSTLLIAWGIVASCSAFIYDETSLYVMRLLLGLTEAGYWPGVLLYMCSWFPSAYRGRAVTLVFLGSPFANVLGFPLSGALLELPKMLGLVSWQWLFIIEGSPAILIGLVAIICLRDKPESADWLTMEEKNALRRVLHSEGEGAAKEQSPKLSSAASHPLVPFFCLVNFLYAIGIYTVVFGSPRLIENFGNLTYLEVGLVGAAPFLLGSIALWLCGLSSDRLGDRKWHVAGMFLLTSLGLVGIVAATSLITKVTFLSVAVMGSVGQAGVQYALFTEGFGRISPNGKVLAARLALAIMAGGVGGFVAPYTVGVIVQLFGDFTYALLGVAVVLAFAGALVAVVSANFMQLSKPARPFAPGADAGGVSP